jgi:CheY-like chemotaxis protein
VLLIEDDQICQNIAKNIFEDLFCSVTVASTAQQALDLCGNKYDMIFVDIGLPDRDGIALTQELRKKLHIDVPIIATTAYAWDVNSYNEVGINDYIRKPLTYAKLRRVLHRYL